MPRPAGRMAESRLADIEARLCRVSPRSAPLAGRGRSDPLAAWHSPSRREAVGSYTPCPFLGPAAVTRASRHDNPAGARPQAVCVEAVTDGGVARRRGPRRRTGLPRRRTRRHLRPGRDGADHDRAGTEHRDGKCGGQDDSLTRERTVLSFAADWVGGDGGIGRGHDPAVGHVLGVVQTWRQPGPHARGVVRPLPLGCRRTDSAHHPRPVSRPQRAVQAQSGRTRNVVTGLGRRGGARRPPQTRPRGPCAMCCV